MDENIICAEGLCRSFPVGGGEFHALKNISLEIPRGKLTMLRGRSGSGKTTLMNILGALDLPNSGKLFFEGKDVCAMDERGRDELRRTRIGFIFQSVALVSMMTAAENVEFALRIAGFDENERSGRAMECLKLVGLGTRSGHMPAEMSGGEQQRVAIARAVAHRPAVVFADEPTAELDSATGLQVVKSFRELVDGEGATVVMTTHDVGLLEYADRIYSLEDGELTDA